MVYLYNEYKLTRPVILVLDDSNDSRQTLQKILQTRTRKQISSNWFIYRGKLIAPNKHKYLTKVNSYNMDEIETTLRNAPFPDYFSKAPRKIYDLSIEIYGDVKNLYNPKIIPENAVPIFYDDGFAYLQITKSGILITRGYFFAREKIGEACTEEYCIEKHGDKWLVWVGGNFYWYDGKRFYYKNKRVSKDMISHIGGYEVRFDGEKYYVIDYSDRKTTYPKEYLDRVAISIGNKKFYVPMFTIPAVQFLIGGEKND